VYIGCLDENTNSKQSKKGEQKLAEAWAKVRPQDQNFPKRTEPGHENKELPLLTDGEKALIAVVHPVVTIMINIFQNKKFRQESLSLLQSSDETWATVLLRENLKGMLLVVERRFGEKGRKYIVGNAERVRQWLLYFCDYLF